MEYKDSDIISRKEIYNKIIKIAKGELKVNKNEPKVWYETKEIKEKVLSNKI